MTDRFCERLRQYRTQSHPAISLNSLSYFAPKIWDMIPSEIKSTDSLQKLRLEKMGSGKVFSLSLSALYTEFKIC